jgi:acetylglutamate kinase
MMTNIPGVMDKSGNLLTDLTAREIDALFADGDDFRWNAAQDIIGFRCR